ncbi:hypothetical protein FVR03_01390 [Pontibacter qinzhouensis]|uniref:Uncharacterized protein n=1 Tax=Pontibacter qinzhouensis TaxID=2603253 RepID=A0A5C8KD94_9BACT|nr:hypothetical protein [Pontibacter qinzhouensis]TXK52398.1 hypothetical protein FVR03_01390 [Pontibacter qinzhouensis]
MPVEITLRSSRPPGEGNGLTNDEIDGNFTGLKTAVDKLEFSATAGQYNPNHPGFNTLKTAVIWILQNMGNVIEEPQEPEGPAYDTTLANGENVGAVTLTSLPDVLFHFNGLEATGDPFPARLELFAGGEAIGAVDFTLQYLSQPCGITYNGTMYHKTFIDGTLNILA